MSTLNNLHPPTPMLVEYIGKGKLLTDCQLVFLTNETAQIENMQARCFTHYYVEGFKDIHISLHVLWKSVQDPDDIILRKPPRRGQFGSNIKLNYFVPG